MNLTKRGYFKPGNKLGGRKPLDLDFKALLLEQSPQALQTIIEIMNNPKASNRERLEASKIIIERVYGKPIIPIVDVNKYSGIQLTIKNLRESLNIYECENLKGGN